VGTGRFAVPLGIRVGVEPAKTMADIAQKRGIEVHEEKAEKLHFDDSTFDFVLIVVTICFVQDPVQVLREAKRVLKPGGYIIIGMIDKESFLGKLYESKKKESKFYRHANFYFIGQVLDWLKKLKYEHIKTCQTIFKNPKEITVIEPVKEGHGEGGFTVISAQKEV
jgi:ubiquinone/menaquinone biosynthesis C-methylase UbiE